MAEAVYKVRTKLIINNKLIIWTACLILVSADLAPDRNEEKKKI